MWVCHSLKISDPLQFMVFPWGNSMSSDNGQGIEYLLKKVRIRGKFNVFLTTCVMACPSPNSQLIGIIALYLMSTFIHCQCNSRIVPIDCKSCFTNPSRPCQSNTNLSSSPAGRDFIMVNYQYSEVTYRS